MIERAKEEIGALLHTEKSHNDHKETHGMRTDIDEKTPLDNVKAPNMFERAKEEFEAIVEAIHPKKESPTHGKRFPFFGLLICSFEQLEKLKAGLGKLIICFLHH